MNKFIDTTFAELTIGDSFIFEHDLDLFNNGPDLAVPILVKENVGVYKQLATALLDRRKNPTYKCHMGRGHVEEKAKVKKLIYDNDTSL